MHLEILQRGPFQPDLARLERFDQVRQMEKPEYRESWAWVYFMLHADPAMPRVLLDYLQILAPNPNPGPLLPRLPKSSPIRTSPSPPSSPPPNTVAGACGKGPANGPA